MSPLFKRAATAALLLASGLAEAQDVVTLTGTATPSVTATACAAVLTPSYAAPVAARGWKAQLVATGLKTPRGIKFDTNGGLLVIESGARLTHLTLKDNGGTCVSVERNTTLLEDEDLNHGLELSEDGRTIYVSTAENVDRHSYDPDTLALGNLTRLIANMTNPGRGHVSRTLLLSRKQPEMLLVSRGSASNIDPLAADISTGVSQIRAFNLTTIAANTELARPYSYPADGILVGWGLRNSVGVAEHPTTGGIFSVENSADNIIRLGVDIHEDNPGEELNAHAALSDPRKLGANHGYPSCFALWNTTDFPSLGDLHVGSHFALSNNATANDTSCDENTTSPRLTFQAHTAPLDIIFSPADGGDRAFISFHGSWNREHPAGYKLAYVDFVDGQPVEPRDSVTAARDVLTAPDTAACEEHGACFRPVGLAFDAAGERLFVSSDATGEIWVVMRDGEEGEGGSDGDGNGEGGDGTPTSTGDGAPGGETSTAAAVPGVVGRGVGGLGWGVVGVTVAMVAAGGLGFMA